jgi:hypothetical protein
MANDRIFYACQGVGISDNDILNPTIRPVHGVQSIGITTSFNLEQAFELGQLEIYENIEALPDVEVTLEKVLDGYPLIWHLATTGVNPFTANSLTARAKTRCDLRLGIYDESFENISDSDALPTVEVYCSGMYLSSVSYSFPIDGNSTESVTLVGNTKVWFDAANDSRKLTAAIVNSFDGTDVPAALAAGNGGIQRREDINLSASIFPDSIEGVAGNVAGNANNNGVHIQSVTISTDFNREDLFELGSKAPYARPAGFPIEVTCDIETTAVSGDYIFAYEEGLPAYNGGVNQGNNTAEESIFIQTRSGYQFNLGSKNRLSSVTYGGGDAGGGNVTCTYSYSNFNSLQINDTLNSL